MDNKRQTQITTRLIPETKSLGQINLLHLALVATTGIFAVFLCWIIYMANTGQDTVFFAFSRQVPLGDKASHFLLFGILTLLCNCSWPKKHLQLYKQRIPIGTLLIVIFVTFEECSQYFLPNRAFDLYDYAASLLGITLFTIVCRLMRFSHRLSK